MEGYQIDVMQTTMSKDKLEIDTIMIIGRHQYITKTIQNEKTDGFYQTVRLAMVNNDHTSSFGDMAATNPNNVLIKNETSEYKTIERAHVRFVANLGPSNLEKEIHRL